jgi:hypothetical protein
MADTLCDLGSLVTDETLVLNLLHGLSPSYAILTWNMLFPSFSWVRSDLLLEELTTTAISTTDAATGLYSGKPRGRLNGPLLLPLVVPYKSRAPPPSSSNPHPTTNFGGVRCHCQGGHDRNSIQGGPPLDRGDGSWPSFYNLWTGSISMWPRPPVGPPSSCWVAPPLAFYAAPPPLAIPTHSAPPQL